MNARTVVTRLSRNLRWMSCCDARGRQQPTPTPMANPPPPAAQLDLPVPDGEVRMIGFAMTVPLIVPVYRGKD
jgi:hypothetical protein